MKVRVFGFLLVLFASSLAGKTATPADAQTPAQNPDNAITVPLERPLSQEEKRRSVFQKEQEKSAEITYRYAVELRSEGHNERAYGILGDFLIRFPGHARTYSVRLERADILREMGESEDAANLDLETCRLFRNEERGGRLCLRAAKLLNHLGETDRALSVLKETVKRYPATDLSRLASIEISLISDASRRADNISVDSKPEEQPKKEETQKDHPLPEEMPGEGVFDANKP